MAIEYFLELADAFGTRVTTFSDMLELQYSYADKRVGSLEVILPGRYANILQPVVPPLHRPYDFKKHYQLRLYRRVDGGALTLEPGCVWIITRPGRRLDREGGRAVKLVAQDWKWVLTTRKIAYHSAHEKAHHKEVAAMDLPKLWFRDSFTNQPDMEPGRELETGGHLTMAPLVGGGPILSQPSSYEDLFLTMVEACEQSFSKNHWMTFDFSSSDGVGGFPWTLQTYSGQPRLDRTPGVHPRPVIFSPWTGEITEIDLAPDYGEEITAVYGLGPGQGDSRLQTVVQDEARQTGTPWGRIEGVEAVTEAENIDEVTTAAQGRLQRGNPLYTLTATIEDSRHLRYGRDYFYGDRVAIDFDSQRVLMRIVGVQCQVKDGKHVRKFAFEQVI